MDPDAAKIVAYTYAYTYLFPVICIAGIIGNSLLLATLKLGSLRDSPYIYLATLATADLIALICVSGICMVRCDNCSSTPISEYIGKSYEAYAYLPVSNMAALMVSFTTFTMTIERFIYVRHPMSANNIITRRKTKIIVCLLTIISIGLNFPRFFLYDVKTSTQYGPFYNSHNHTVPKFLTLNCVPQRTNYALNKDMYCNISLPPGFINGSDTRDAWVTSPDDRCVVNLGQLVKIDNLILMDSVFNYDVENYHRVVYNLTDAVEIGQLLAKFPCKKTTKYWEIGNFYAVKNSTHFVLGDTHFYRTMDERYFLFVSILYIAPYVGVAILNCYIITIVRKSATRRKSKLMARTYSIKSVKMAEQDHLTMTLLGLTGIELLANLVYSSSITPLAKLIYEDFKHNQNYQIHVVASNLFILIQYSSNFLFFAFFNGRFRREFRKVLLNRLSARLKDVSSSTLRREARQELAVIRVNPLPRLSTSTMVSYCADS